MEGVTGTMAWLGHVPARCRRGVYGHADIDKPPFFSYRVYVAEMEAAVSGERQRSGSRQRRHFALGCKDPREKGPSCHYLRSFITPVLSSLPFLHFDIASA